MNQYELKHVASIPHFIHGTTAYTFELDGGVASQEHCIPIGTFNSATQTIEYVSNWRDLVEPRLAAFRASLTSHARNDSRVHLIKPQKPRKTTRNPRKPSSRTKNPKSQQGGSGGAMSSD